MTSTAAAVLAAERSVEGQLPVWLALAIIALVLLGGYAATAGTARSDRRGSARPPRPEPLGHPLDRIDPVQRPNTWAGKFLCERQRVQVEKVLGALCRAAILVA